MLTVNEALKCLLEMAAQVPESEMLAISKANGRVLAESQYSGIDVPNADNAAMDGYAIRFSDLNGTGTVLTVRQRVPAGHIGGKLQNGEAAVFLPVLPYRKAPIRLSGRNGVKSMETG